MQWLSNISARWQLIFSNYMLFSMWTSEAKCSLPSEVSSANWQTFLQGEIESQHWSLPLSRWGPAAKKIAELTWRVAGWWCSSQTLWPFCGQTGWPPQAGWPVERRWSHNSLDRRHWWTCKGMWLSPDSDPRTRFPPCKPEGREGGGVSVIYASLWYSNLY